MPDILDVVFVILCNETLGNLFVVQVAMSALSTTQVASLFHPMLGRHSEVHISFPVGTDRMSLHYEPLRDGCYLRFGLQNNSIQLT